MGTLLVRSEDRWTRRDWAIVLACAFVFGWVYLLWDYVYQFFLVHLHVPLAATSLINGMWFMGGFIPMALTRKPGTCVVGESLAAAWEIALGYLLATGDYPIQYSGETYTSFWMSFAPGAAPQEFRVLNVVVFVGILEGMGPEMGFGLKRYLDFSLPTWIVACSLGAVLEWMTGIWVTHYYYAGQSTASLWGTLVTSVIGIGFIAGSVAWWVGERWGPKPPAEAP